MGRLSPNQLTAREVASLKEGVHGDGGNLWLTVKGGSRTWSVRFKSPATGSRREMGLGSARDISLAAARKLASEAREALRRGIDPIEHRTRLQQAKRTAPTFEEVATRYIGEMRPGWRDPRAFSIWTSSLVRLAYPHLGRRPIESVGTDDILAVLRPIWPTTTETADRLRGRMERVLDYAASQGWRGADNPARWKGHLAHILPKPNAVTQVAHHAAVPWRQIGVVMAALARSDGVSARAVMFACLTAARSGEVRGATWCEVDLHSKTWTVPAERMKAKREHRVPLSPPAIALLEPAGTVVRSSTDLVFRGGREGRPLSDVAMSKALHLAAGTRNVTVHGLRSAFRDWVAESTDYPREVAEMALAHAIGDRVEAAYRRGDLFAKRLAMMDDWAAFTTGSSAAAESE